MSYPAKLSDSTHRISVLAVGRNHTLYKALEHAQASDGSGYRIDLHVVGHLSRKALRPDLLLIDLDDEEQTVCALKTGSSAYPDARPLVLISRDDEEWLTLLTELGAAFLMLRPVDPSMLILRVRQVACPELLRPDVRLEALQRSRIEEEAAALLKELGVPEHFKGFAYLKTAIALALMDETLLRRMTTGLYPKVAQLFGVRAPRLERAMRHAIEVTWTRGNMASIHSLFAYSINHEKGKPTNGLFIARLVDHLRLNHPSNPSA